MHVDVSSDTILSPGFLAEVHDLLWSSTTFDWHGWKSEDSFAAFEILSEFAHLMCEVKSIHTSNWAFRIVKSIERAFNKIVSKFDSRAHYQVIISQRTFIIINIESVVIWVQISSPIC